VADKSDSQLPLTPLTPLTPMGSTPCFRAAPEFFLTPVKWVIIPTTTYGQGPATAFKSTLELHHDGHKLILRHTQRKFLLHVDLRLSCVTHAEVDPIGYCFYVVEAGTMTPRNVCLTGKEGTNAVFVQTHQHSIERAFSVKITMRAYGVGSASAYISIQNTFLNKWPDLGKLYISLRATTAHGVPTTADLLKLPTDSLVPFADATTPCLANVLLPLPPEPMEEETYPAPPLRHHSRDIREGNRWHGLAYCVQGVDNNACRPPVASCEHL